MEGDFWRGMRNGVPISLVLWAIIIGGVVLWLR